MPLSAEKRRDYDARRQLAVTNRTADVALTFAAAFKKGPQNKKRRKEGAASLIKFCQIYGGATFSKPFSPSHLAAAERIEAAVLRGEQLALAMPRGSGKTSLCRWAVIWAVANGHSPYCILIGATDRAARKQLRLIKDILRFNDLLAADYPEMCLPCRHLQGEPRKATSQHFEGTPTGIIWGMDQVVLAHIPLKYAQCSEAVIDVAGITGDVRGRQHVRRDGSTVRPTVAIVDDPQTRRSARSEPDTDAREDTINGDVKYLAGPDRPVGVVVPCTVIRGGDLADRMLDREKYPEWHGTRTRFFESMPSDAAMQHWEGEYARLRRQAMREDREPVEANKYYASHQEVMDEGADASWPERYYADKGELSAVQRGMNEYLRDRRAFIAEYQNDPEEAIELPTVPMATEKELLAMISGHPRGTGISSASRIVGMIDVHATALYWAVAAVKDDFTGGLIDAGTYPKQPTKDFTLRTLKVTLQDQHPGGVEAAIIAGLLKLTDTLCRRDWKSADGQSLPMSLVLIDTGYMPAEVARACLTSPHKALLMGSRGVGFGPLSKPMTEYDTSEEKVRRAGPDRSAPRWYVPRDTPHGLQVVRFDADFWKATLHARFCTSPGEPGEWNLWGDAHEDHRPLVRHLLSQVPREKSGNGRTVNVFDLRSGYEDHWLDTAVGCTVAASFLGCSLPGQRPLRKKPKSKKRRRRGFVYANDEN